MTKAELTAEKRPACMSPGSASSTKYGYTNATDEDKGSVQVLVVLFGVVAVKFCRLSTIYSKEVGSGIIGPERFDELSEDGMEADLGVSDGLGVTVIGRIERTTLDRSGRPVGPAVEGFLAWDPYWRTSPSVVVVGRG